MQRKIPKLQIFRLIVQILFFIILPGLFDLTFTGLKQAYLMLLSGKINIVQLLPDLLEALIIIPITILFGRFFCGWMCAFGAFNDFIYMISRKVFRMKLRIPEKLDSILKYLKYGILVFIVLVIWTTKVGTFSKLSPWEAFAQMGELPFAFIKYTAGFIILMLIVLGAILVERFFCRYLCPLGAIFSLVSRVRFFKIDKNKDKCGTCKLCTKNCSMGIPLYKMNKVKTGECINCFKCIETCPRKNPQAVVFNERLNPSFAGAVVIATFTGLYSVGSMAVNASNTMLDACYNTQASIGSSALEQEEGNAFAAAGDAAGASNSNAPAPESTVTAPQKADSSPAPSSTPVSGNDAAENDTSASPSASQSIPAHKNTYVDGTYTGMGFGHRSGLEVSITVSNDKITDIQIVSSRETPRYSYYVFQTVPQEILQAQSANVAAISGATESSDGVMMAVKDALSKARA